MDEDAQRTTLQDALGHSYTLERELGRGGMASVYLAEDVKHARPVAVKVLLPELTATIGAERFRREIALAARLQHPHILTVLDSGETATGQLWFTMPFVDGETLRERLRREKQLPLDDALRITSAVASALAYAHKYGVIHRDIKPENILLTAEGDALLADFGIAQWPVHAPDQSFTKTGFVVGSASYMSPEQAAGERDLDGRSDIFSLGCVLYEMLTGEPPFTGATPEAIIARRLMEQPRPVSAVRARIPETVRRALDTALAKAPADRFRTASAFADALTSVSPQPRFSASRYWIVAGAAALVATIGYGVWRMVQRAPAGPVRLAVLPFENLGDSADGYFADGITDAIRGKLTAVPGLSVVWSGTAAHYARAGTNAQAIAREFGDVRYVLVGRIRWAKAPSGMSRVEVTPALVDVRTGTDAWEQSFNQPLTDVFQVQGDIARAVAEQLRVTLTPATRVRLAAQPTSNLDAYDFYLRGKALDQRGTDAANRRRAADAYAEAVRRDSTFALAWSGLSHALSIVYWNGVQLPADSQRAHGAASRALSLAPDLPEAHEALGTYQRTVLNDPIRASAEFREGLRLGPDNAELLLGLGLTEDDRGRRDTALVLYERAVRVEPRSPRALFDLGTSLADLCRLDEARTILDRELAIEPGDMTGIGARFGIALQQNDLAGARAVLQRAAPNVDSLLLLAQVSFGIFSWGLDTANLRRMTRLPLAVFDGHVQRWLEVRATGYFVLGDTAAQRPLNDSLFAIFETRVRAHPDDRAAQLERGVALSIMGRGQAAVDGAESAVAGIPIAENPGPHRAMAGIYARAGMKEKAMRTLTALRAVPCAMPALQLRMDPSFAPLRSDPGFERLAALSR